MSTFVLFLVFFSYTLSILNSTVCTYKQMSYTTYPNYELPQLQPMSYEISKQIKKTNKLQ